jgi:hypothetical protein
MRQSLEMNLEMVEAGHTSKALLDILYFFSWPWQVIVFDSKVVGKLFLFLQSHSSSEWHFYFCYWHTTPRCCLFHRIGPDCCRASLIKSAPLWGASLIRYPWM